MKNWEEKMMYAIYGLFGAGLGFLIFAVALGGWQFLFIGRSSKPWNGLAALILCLVIGFGWGLVACKLRDRELGNGSSIYEDEATAILFTKRLMVIATCLAALYFIWELAKGM